MSKKKTAKGPKQPSDSDLLDKLTSLVFLLFVCSLMLSHLAPLARTT